MLCARAILCTLEVLCARAILCTLEVLCVRAILCTFEVLCARAIPNIEQDFVCGIRVSDGLVEMEFP